jgi:hypothetical protein
MRFAGEPVRYLRGHAGHWFKRKQGRPQGSPPPPPADGICMQPGCITRITAKHLEHGWHTCMRHDGAR